MPSGVFCTLPHKSPNLRAVFERWTLKFCARVQCVPAKPFTNVFFFLSGNLGSLKTQISQKIQNPNIWRKKKENKNSHSQKARQGHIKHVCKISGSISQKRRGHWTLKELGVLCLNQPVLRTITENHSNQDPRFTLKPICTPIFTHHIRSWLLCTPVNTTFVVDALTVFVTAFAASYAGNSSDGCSFLFAVALSWLSATFQTECNCSRVRQLLCGAGQRPHPRQQRWIR